MSWISILLIAAFIIQIVLLIVYYRKLETENEKSALVDGILGGWWLMWFIFMICRSFGIIDFQ